MLVIYLILYVVVTILAVFYMLMDYLCSYIDAFVWLPAEEFLLPLLAIAWTFGIIDEDTLLNTRDPTVYDRIF